MEKLESEVLQLVTFRIGEEEYAINILNVQEIIRMIDVTRIPDVPVHVKGVVNLRGRVVPVVSLRNKFGFEETSSDDDSRIIVVNVMNVTMGLIVDLVSEVLRLSSDIVGPPPQVLSGNGNEFVYGVAKLDSRLLMLIHLEKLLEVQDVLEAVH